MRYATQLLASGSDVRHRDASFLTALWEPDALGATTLLELREMLFILGGITLLLPTPHDVVCTASMKEITASANRLQTAAAVRMERLAQAYAAEHPDDPGEFELPVTMIVTLGMFECGWTPDIDGARMEFQRIGRLDLVAALDEAFRAEAGH